MVIRVATKLRKKLTGKLIFQIRKSQQVLRMNTIAKLKFLLKIGDNSLRAEG
jgi:hypothetical protein